MSAPTNVWSARRPVIWGLAISLMVVAGFGGWSQFAQIDGAVVASGQFEVDRNRIVIQHPYDGVVAQVDVDEGDRVQKGDLLMSLEAEELRASLAIVEGQYFDLVARRGRLTAEQTGSDTITFDAMLMADSSPLVTEVMTGQQQLFDARRDNAEAAKAQLRKRTDQIKDQIVGLEAQRASLDRQLELIEQELVDQKGLLERGLAQAARVLALEREKASIEGQQGELTASVAQSEGRITENELAILETETRQREEANTELRTIQPQELELAERRQTIRARLDRLEIRAPVTGVVYGLTVFAEGTVIKPADPLMYIVPEDRPLIITSQVAVQDIDQISTGQDVLLRMTAFNQRTTPELFGHITSVSADAFQDRNTGASYYRVEIQLDEGEADKLPEGLTLIPGMPVEAFIRTEQRTPMEFILKPLTDNFARAFKEG